MKVVTKLIPSTPKAGVRAPAAAGVRCRRAVGGASLRTFGDKRRDVGWQ
jgi:hypothetical protein